MRSLQYLFRAIKCWLNLHHVRDVGLYFDPIGVMKADGNYASAWVGRCYHCKRVIRLVEVKNG